uniref:F-box domain-containing protein n=1 Tax=Caenorhabditis brenneri TaxID=135651 RepID=B6VBP3_CAEBE|nr:hypothetical protein Cbre_JD17.002 [Caenorhabditis brenneri]
MSFPLLRLPLVASTNVTNSIDIEDYFPLIRTSTRMKNLIKYSRVPIELTVYGDEHIEFEKLSDPDRTKRVELFLPPRSTGQNKYVLFEPFIRRKSNYKCERNLEGYRKLMDDFVDIFLVKSIDLRMIYVNISEICVQYLEYALSLGLKIKSFSVSDQKYCVEDIRKMLFACAHISSLTVYMSDPPKKSVLDCFQKFAVDTLELDVTPGCITLDHLFALVNCSYVNIGEVRFDEADLNKFLKYWLSGTSRLRTMAIKLTSGYRGGNYLNAQLVMEGIDGREIERNKKFEIERSDGVKTIVSIYNIAITLGDFDRNFLEY